MPIDKIDKIYSIGHKVLYVSVFFTLLFVCIILLTHYIFQQIKPDCIKTNSKIDKDKQFYFTIGISLSIFLVLMMIVYQVAF